jgi:hypothetical protein
VREAADGYARHLRADARDYADRILAELVETLRRTQATAEQGRGVLAQRPG